MLSLCLFAALSLMGQPQDTPFDGATLEEHLKSESPIALAADAKRLGNASKGAIVFYQAHVTCARCHLGEGDQPPIGPDLAQLGKSVSDVYLIESVLDPSKEIKKGFATIKLATKDGRTVTGLLVEETPDKLVLRDLATPNAQRITIAKAEIEERNDHGPSSMPSGLANSLKSRQQFLDLIKYLRDVADGGPARQKALKPAAALLAPPSLPDYERDLDHAGLIAGLNRASLKRGEAIYNRVCATCHGTKTQEGSLPTSLKFASGMFKNGSDPYSMYKTVTNGFNQMPAQPWMVPKQKYDVIHYIRETYVKPTNKTQYKPVDPSYLAGLPKGRSRGPDPVIYEPWSKMNYGPTMMATIELGRDGTNIAHKGVAIRLDPGPGGISQGKAWALYDRATMRLAGFWTGTGFIDWRGINFDGQHGIHPSVAGEVRVKSPAGPGWANPSTDSFEDPRLKGRDGKPYGPMPKEWLKYRGLYRYGDQAILSYTVGQVPVLDSVDLVECEAMKGTPVVRRTLEVGPCQKPLRVVLDDGTSAHAVVSPEKWTVARQGGKSVLTLPPADKTRVYEVYLCNGQQASLDEAVKSGAISPKSRPALSTRLAGGPAQWPERLQATIASEPDDGPFAIDILAHPATTPWHSQMRFTGLDFLPDGDGMAVCDWDGDVWHVSGLKNQAGILTWKRIASGLFQPLGLKLVNGNIYITCRDEIVILRDLNGDGETDFYDCFNDDQQVTEHFHEFAMDLQTDAEGNFYYTKGARHALTALVPQHGTLLKVSKDGSKTEILATGFRAPNGVGINSDGTFYVTDQEGHWTPKNRVNWVKPGKFYGNLWGFTDLTDTSDDRMEPPICWITNAFDRSPSQVIAVTSNAWKPLKGHHITLSYGYGKVFLLLEETKGDLKQGGLVELPIRQFPTGLIRGRFRPEDGALYACGMYAWAGNQQQPGGLYRIRRTNKPLYVPTAIEAGPSRLTLTFSEPLDAASVKPEQFALKTWDLKRSQTYGSKHLNEGPLEVTGAKLASDRKTVILEVPKLAPTMGMEVKYNLKAVDGAPVTGFIHNTIHRLNAQGGSLGQ